MYLADLKSNHCMVSFTLASKLDLSYFDSYSLTVQVVQDVGANSIYIQLHEHKSINYMQCSGGKLVVWQLVLFYLLGQPVAVSASGQASHAFV